MTSSFGTGDTVKPESYTNGEESKIKLEPDSLYELSGVQSDEDLYEDAGDLDFSGAIQGIYLTRIPRLLWENWSKLDDDQEIQIGTVRIEGVPGDVKRVCHHLQFPHEQSKHDILAIH